MRRVVALTLAILTVVLSGTAYAEGPPPPPQPPSLPQGTAVPVHLTLVTTGSTALTASSNPYSCWVQSDWPHESTSGSDLGYIHGKGHTWCDVWGIVWLRLETRLYERFGWGWWELNMAPAEGTSSARITAVARTRCDGNVLYRVESQAWARDPAGNTYYGKHIGQERWVNCQPW